jgi:hypothetical protein
MSCTVGSVLHRHNALRGRRCFSLWPFLGVHPAAQMSPELRPTSPHRIWNRLSVIKTEHVSCRSRKASGSLESRMREQHEGLRVLAALRSEYMFERYPSSSGTTPITPLQTSYTDDEDRPVAVYRRDGFDPLSDVRVLFGRECPCSGQCESGLHDSRQGRRAQAAEDDIRSAE